MKCIKHWVEGTVALRLKDTDSLNRDCPRPKWWRWEVGLVGRAWITRVNPS